MLELPTDKPRPRLQSFNGALVPFTVDGAVADRLRKLASGARTTLFTALMAAFQVLLARHCRQDDVPVGTSLANRERLETQGLVGFFVNMVVVRGDLSGDPGFGQLLERLRGLVLEAFDHATLPFEMLVEALDLPRDTSRNPLFQVAFTLLDATPPKVEAGGFTVEPLLTQEAARFDLELFVREQGRRSCGGVLVQYGPVRGGVRPAACPSVRRRCSTPPRRRPTCRCRGCRCSTTRSGRPC